MMGILLVFCYQEQKGDIQIEAEPRPFFARYIDTMGFQAEPGTRGTDPHLRA